MQKDRERTIEITLLIIGCVIYALSCVLIKDVAVIPGSFLGIAVTANKMTGVPVGMTNLLLNIPVMVLATRKLGPKVLIYTVFIMTATSLLIDWWSPLFPVIRGNAYWLSVAGGVSMGLGAGLLILAKGTMAGTTALTLLVQKVLTRFRFGTILFAMDGCIVLLGAVIAVGDWRAILYSLLYSFSCAKTMDLIMILGQKFGLESA